MNEHDVAIEVVLDEFADLWGRWKISPPNGSWDFDQVDDMVRNLSSKPIDKISREELVEGFRTFRDLNREWFEYFEEVARTLMEKNY